MNEKKTNLNLRFLFRFYLQKIKILKALIRKKLLLRF